MIMKFLLICLAMLSFSAFADEKTYSCVSDTNLKFFTYGDSANLHIVANIWGGKGFYHIEREREGFPIFLNELSQENVYALSLEGFGGAKEGTEILLPKEIKTLSNKDSSVFINHPQIGEQVYFCQLIK
jgi:hypothetical protein